jgi:hypothetical protein
LRPRSGFQTTPGPHQGSVLAADKGRKPLDWDLVGGLRYQVAALGTI